MTSNQINMLRYLEDVRHNQSYERETNRANVAREKETYRSNLAKETLNRYQLLETNRHNTMSEYLDRSNLAESIRHNQVVERETNRTNLAKEIETNRSNEARETETNRHNEEQERIDWAKANSQTSLNKAKTFREYVGGATDIVNSAMGVWKTIRGSGNRYLIVK